uniref:Uncharacterized protein n=1 Tax=Anguilla anguilla TaxID=7936 RepID=A0A0E9WXX0_ANGAN
MNSGDNYKHLLSSQGGKKYKYRKTQPLFCWKEKKKLHGITLAFLFLKNKKKKNLNIYLQNSPEMFFLLTEAEKPLGSVLFVFFVYFFFAFLLLKLNFLYTFKF